ncbi:hypothetical protein [Corynebacterium camporealensis]|uniref:hypothetical protein n=1 Tax=Corynebacterium camporealensis TaxID=161896 RepID=UPI00052BB1A1|nr:hypothetical protein [Corynebacterium camporealensis]
MSTTNQPPASARAPWSVWMASLIAIAQSLVVITFGIFLVVRDINDADNPSMVSSTDVASHVGTGTAVFIFIIFGFVIAGAIAFLLGKRWGRGAIVLVEFILIPSSFQMMSGGSIYLGILTLVTAVITLYLMMFSKDTAAWAEMNF